MRAPGKRFSFDRLLSRWHVLKSGWPIPAGSAAERSIAIDGAGHATRPAAAGSQLRASNRNDLDARLFEPLVGLGVALVRDGHLGRQGKGVVAVVPLLTFGRHGIQTGVDH